MDTIEAMIKTSRDVDYATQQQFEDLWTSLGNSYQQLKFQGEKFLTESRIMVNDPNLDVKSAQMCVESLLEQFGSRHIGAGRMWAEWQTKCRQDKEFQQHWQSFVNDCRKVSWKNKKQKMRLASAKSSNCAKRARKRT